MNTSTLRFPVITIKDGSVSLEDSEEQLRTCTRKALSSRWYDGMKIIDSAGVEYVTKRASYVRDTGRRMFSGLFAPKLVEVQLDIEHVRQLDVEHARRLLVNALREQWAYWDASDELNDIKSELDAAASMEELLKAVRPLLVGLL